MTLSKHCCLGKLLNNKLLPCPICHGGKKKWGTTTFTVDLGDGVEVVRDVPALVCDLCETDWIQDDSAEILEQIVLNAKQKHLVVEVAHWRQAMTSYTPYRND